MSEGRGGKSRSLAPFGMTGRAWGKKWRVAVHGGGFYECGKRLGTRYKIEKKRDLFTHNPSCIHPDVPSPRHGLRAVSVMRAATEFGSSNSSPRTPTSETPASVEHAH